MFSKSRINEPGPKHGDPDAKPAEPTAPKTAQHDAAPSQRPKAEAAGVDPVVGPVVKGNMKTTGDIAVEGTVEGDIRAHLLTVGETATVKGEVRRRRRRGQRPHHRSGARPQGAPTVTARVEGDIIHKTIAIESGAHFEGSVQRQEDPLNPRRAARCPAAKPSDPNS